MAFSEIFRITRQTRILIVILIVISLCGFLVAWIYYSSINKSEDPRVIGARLKLCRFDPLLERHRYREALLVLDTVFSIYMKTPGYEKSYEIGMVFNNRCSAFLTMALYDTLSPDYDKNHLLQIAGENALKSISVYEYWLDSAGQLTKDQIRENITSSFTDDPAMKGKEVKKIIEKRVEDIANAQIETPRRLSVSYTNLGIVQRHQYRQEEAVQSYLKAIELWKDNHTARSNFNVLMGKPPEDRSIIDKLFPPERLKTD